MGMLIPLFAAGTPGLRWEMILPFVLLLVAIAVVPLANPLWWSRHYPKVSAILALVTASWYFLAVGDGARILVAIHEYVGFIALIGSLFVVSGGIHVGVKGEATPAINCLFLLVGAGLANLIGTTGASMLLIRPWIRMNKYRITEFHLVFFIFMVSNIGGCLTPIGDPPLFLGYLKGVPFWWVLQKCLPAWLVAMAFLLGTFYLFDRRNFSRAPKVIREAETAQEKWRVDGLSNLVFLAVILVAVFLRHPAGLSEGLMVAAAVGSYLTTPKSVHEANHFDFHPIREVAWLFGGIFVTMVPALQFLGEHARELGRLSASALFWLTGSLSTVLDNAPTYLAILATKMGLDGLSINDPEQVRRLAINDPAGLTAISIGAVFFGAMTYLGNGPNLMVAAIADHAKVRRPGFFRYLLRFALPILLPLLALIWAWCLPQ
jgi:Na+/H+ antiporter NhaD/arsenite permease-like protein